MVVLTPRPPPGVHGASTGPWELSSLLPTGAGGAAAAEPLANPSSAFAPRPPTNMSQTGSVTFDNSAEGEPTAEPGPAEPWRTADRDLFASLPLTPRGSLPSISVAELASSVGSCDPEGSASFIDHPATARRRWNTPSWKSAQTERGRTRKNQQGFARSRHWSSVANPPHVPLSVAEVGRLLQQHGLGKYVAAFRSNKVDGRILPKLTDNLLKRLGMHGAGDRMLLLKLREGWLKQHGRKPRGGLGGSSTASFASQTARSDRDRYLPSDPALQDYHQVTLPKSWMRRWNSFDHTSGWAYLLERAARQGDGTWDSGDSGGGEEGGPGGGGGVVDQLQPEVLVAMPGKLGFRPAAVHREQQAEARARYASIRRGEHLDYRQWVAAQGSKARMHRAFRAGAYTWKGADWEQKFERFDSDRDGKVDWPEFLHAMRVDGKVSVRDMSDAQVNEVFRYLDADGSGAIELGEFIRFMRDESHLWHRPAEESRPLAPVPHQEHHHHHHHHHQPPTRDEARESGPLQRRSFARGVTPPELTGETPRPRPE
eukprot:SAG22_NODE_1448_length_4401_cov_14.320242_2_plen_541_part_00